MKHKERHTGTRAVHHDKLSFFWWLVFTIWLSDSDYISNINIRMIVKCDNFLEQKYFVTNQDDSSTANIHKLLMAVPPRDKLKCFRLDCFKLIIQMDFYSDYFVFGDYAPGFAMCWLGEERLLLTVSVCTICICFSWWELNCWLVQTVCVWPEAFSLSTTKMCHPSQFSQPPCVGIWFNLSVFF